MSFQHDDFDVDAIRDGVNAAMGDDGFVDLIDENPVNPRLDPSRPAILGEQIDDTLPPPPVQSDSYMIDGREVPVEVLRSMISFDDFLRNNPDAARRLTESLQQPQPQVFQQPVPDQPVVETPTQQFSLPPDIDEDDPVIRYVAPQLQELARGNEELRRYIAQQDEQRQQALASQQMNAGIDRFTRQYGGDTGVLSAEDIATIRSEAARVYPGFVMKHNQLVEPATYDALESSMWSLPSIRSKVLGHQADVSQATQREDAARQRKLNALGGRSSGNSSTVPQPVDPRSIKLAMVRDIRSSMGQGETA